MPYRVGPLTPVLSQPLTVPPPPGATRYEHVVVDNVSPFILDVDASGPQGWLQSFTSNRYDLRPGDELVLTPTLEIPGAGSEAVITATWYRAEEKVPGTYPNPLTSQAIVAAISGTVSTQPNTIEIGAYTGTSETITMPVGSWTLEVALAPNANPGLILNVSGALTGVSYDDMSIAPGRQESCNVDTALDDQVVLTWSGAPAGTWYVAVAANPRVIRQAHPVNPTVSANVALSTTQITTVAPPLTYGQYYLFDLELICAATATATPVRVTANPAGTGALAALTAPAQGVDRSGPLGPLAIGDNGLYVAQRTEAALTLIARYAIGVGYP